MKNPVNVEIQIDPKCHDPVILIRTDQKTQQVEDLVHGQRLSADRRISER